MDQEKTNGAPEQPETPQTEPVQPELPEEDAAAAQPDDTTEQETGKPVDAAAQAAAAKAHAEELEKQLAEMKDTLLRTAAEYDNFRKRSAREHDAAFGNGVSHAVNLLLPVLDTLSYAANAATEDENYKKGVLMTMDKANAAFTAMGVEEIETVGKPFNPETATAVMQREAPEGVESGTVLEVLQKGYQLGGKVIRHATVVVAE